MRIVLLMVAACTAALLLFGSFVQAPSLPHKRAELPFLNRAITAGHIPTTAIYVVPANEGAAYRVSQYLNPRTTNALATVTGSVSWTENGTGKSQGISTLALLLATAFVQDSVVVYADASTEISYAATVVGVAGSYDVRIVCEKL
jgi:hypothetical protein